MAQVIVTTSQAPFSFPNGRFIEGETGVWVNGDGTDDELLFTVTEWRQFVADVKAGKHDV